MIFSALLFLSIASIIGVHFSDFSLQIVVVEVNPSACVMLNEAGNVVHWFSLVDTMVDPSDIVVVNQTYFISDFRDHCVCIFNSWGHLTSRLGGWSDSVIRYPRGLGLSPILGMWLFVADTDMNRLHISVWNTQTGELDRYHGLKDLKVELSNYCFNFCIELPID